MEVRKMITKSKHSFLVINSRNELCLKRKQSIFDIISSRIRLDIMKAEDELVRKALESIK